MTRALLNDVSVEFLQANQEPGRTSVGPVFMTVSAPIGLSFDDLVATLFMLGGDSVIESDDVWLRAALADLIVNAGLGEIADKVEECAALRPGSGDHDWLLYCRQRVSGMFPVAVPAARREIAVGA
jgi:hypothetical protein